MFYNAKDYPSDLKLSDHFTGEKFINPTLEEQFSPGFSEIIKMAREGRAKWPDNVENSTVPRLNEALEPGDIALTFINHATFLIQTAEMNILTDPVWSERASPMGWIGPKRVRKPGVAMKDLPAIDLVLVSHNHYDHLDVETLKRLQELYSPKVVVPVGDKALIESIGITNVEEMDWWESIQISQDVRVTFTPTQHSSARGLFDRDKSLWGSYYIECGKRSVYFGGDGGYSTHFSDIKEKMGAPEFAILGIGAYLPDFFMKPIHTSPSEAVKAHLDLEATTSIAMHYGTFQMASEGFDQPLQDLKKAMEKEKLDPASFTHFKVGETKIYKLKESKRMDRELGRP